MSNHKITLEQGAALTKNYRLTLMAALNGYKAGAFDRNSVLEVLNQEGVEGIRIYLGLETNENLGVQLVIVGTDINGNDVTSGVILDYARPCPNECSSPNPLNS